MPDRTPLDTHATAPACPSRRGVLRAGLGATAGLAALPAVAACGGSSGSAVATAVATAAGGGTTLAKLAEVPVGGAVAVKAGGRTVILAQPKAGTVVGFDAACTHAGCPVAPSNGQLVCPCHGSIFAEDTGAVVQGPASRPLAPIGVTVEGDAVVTA